MTYIPKIGHLLILPNVNETLNKPKWLTVVLPDHSALFKPRKLTCLTRDKRLIITYTLTFWNHRNLKAPKKTNNITNLQGKLNDFSDVIRCIVIALFSFYNKLHFGDMIKISLNCRKKCIIYAGSWLPRKRKQKSQPASNL